MTVEHHVPNSTLAFAAGFIAKNICSVVNIKMPTIVPCVGDAPREFGLNWLWQWRERVASCPCVCGGRRRHFRRDLAKFLRIKVLTLRHDIVVPLDDFRAGRQS